MAITVTNNAEGLGEGVIPTTGNTGSSGTACSAVQIDANSSIEARAAAAIHGNRGYRFTLSDTGSASTRLMWSLAGGSARSIISAYVRVHSTVTVTEDLMGLRRTSGNAALLQIRNGGNLVMMNASGGQISASIAPTTLAPGLYLMQIAARRGTSTTDGHLGYAVYDGNTGALIHSWEANDVNAGTEDIVSSYVGRSTGRTVNHILDYDTIRGGTFESGWIAPISQAPIADAGPDQSDIEPGATVTLDATGSTTTIGTITGYSWTQTSGTPVVLSNTSVASPTFIAPLTVNGDSLAFEVIVTNSGGFTDTDSVTVGVLRSTELVRAAGAWSPRLIVQRSSGNWS